MLGAAGMLYAKRHGDAVFRAYHDRVFERFWKRELDIEDIAVVTAVLAEAGADTAGFIAYAATEGPAEVNRISRAAEEAGVFGTPTFVIDGELFWGSEHLPTSARCYVQLDFCPLKKTNAVIEIRQTATFSAWFAKLRDRQAKARVLVRIDRLSLGNPGDVRPSAKACRKCGSIMAPDIGLFSPPRRTGDHPVPGAIRALRPDMQRH